VCKITEANFFYNCNIQMKNIFTVVFHDCKMFMKSHSFLNFINFFNCNKMCVCGENIALNHALLIQERTLRPVQLLFFTVVIYDRKMFMKLVPGRRPVLPPDCKGRRRSSRGEKNRWSDLPTVESFYDCNLWS
jgi:hypothetical protein